MNRFMAQKSIAIAPVFIALTLSLPAAGAGNKCHCRTATSELVEVGNYSCIKTNEGLREARCEFVLNNTAWKLTGNLCPIGLYLDGGKNSRFTVARIDFNRELKKSR